MLNLALLWIFVVYFKKQNHISIHTYPTDIKEHEEEIGKKHWEEIGTAVLRYRNLATEFLNRDTNIFK